MLNTFFYIGYTQNGKLKLGIEKNTTPEDIKIILNKKYIFVKNIYKIPFIQKKQNNKDLYLLFNQGKIFVKNGYPFSKIFEILKDNKNLNFYIKQIEKELKNGKSLYEALKNSDLNLKNSDLMIIKAGEESGNIYSAFALIEQNIKKTEKLKKEIKKLMIYPTIVLVLTFLLVVFIGIYILPDLIKTISDNYLKIPILTKFIIFFSNNCIKISILFLLLPSVIKKYFNNSKRKEKLFNLLLKIRSFETIVNQIFVLNFTNLLNNLFTSGITIIESIEIIEKEISYSYFKKKLKLIVASLKNGETIYHACKETKLFTKIDLELIKFGEESGELEKTFSSINLNLKENLQQKISIFMKLLEPISILIIGLILGSIFWGIYLPMFQIMDHI